MAYHIIILECHSTLTVAILAQAVLALGPCGARGPSRPAGEPPHFSGPIPRHGSWPIGLAVIRSHTPGLAAADNGTVLFHPLVAPRPQPSLPLIPVCCINIAMRGLCFVYIPFVFDIWFTGSGDLAFSVRRTLLWEDRIIAHYSVRVIECL